MSRAFRLGIFIFFTLLFLAAGVFLIGEKHFMFQQTYQLKAQFQDVAGLDNGADVRLGGIHLGNVKYISLPETPDGKLTVVMDMSNSTRNLIRQNSVATIKTEGLLGNKYVEISFGSDKAGEIASGDTIKGETPVDFSDATMSAMNQAKAAAASFAEDADALKQNFFLRGFFNKRGYEDPTELTKNRISQMPSGKTAKSFVYDAGDVFDKSDNAKLKNEKTFDEAGKFLESNKFRLAVIATSAGTGDTEKDKTLTQARAKVVRDLLVQKYKFDDTKLKVIGLGKSANAGDPGKVEILVYD
jgi:outer membrane protein OmpA-like peptidoglycan-associated protein